MGVSPARSPCVGSDRNSRFPEAQHEVGPFSTLGCAQCPCSGICMHMEGL